MNFGLSNGWCLLPLSQSLSLVALHFSLLGKLPFPSLAWVTQSHCWSLYTYQFNLDAYYKYISVSLNMIVSIRSVTIIYRSFCHNHILHPWALSHFTLTSNRVKMMAMRENRWVSKALESFLISRYSMAVFGMAH